MAMTPRRGFSLVELLVVISIIALLVALLSPALTKTKARAKQLQCVHQLRQLGIGFHGFAHDHNSQFPMSVPTDAGGSQEFAENGRRATGEFFFSYRHFQALSNDLSSAKVLACPADTRKPTLSFALLDNTHLSYFVGINASLEQPTAILAGDRNLTADPARVAATTVHTGVTPLQWNAELHRFRGNLLFADGHVQEQRSPAEGLGFADVVLPTTNTGLTRMVATARPTYAAPTRQAAPPAYLPPSSPQNWHVPLMKAGSGSSNLRQPTPPSAAPGPAVPQVAARPATVALPNPGLARVETGTAETAEPEASSWSSKWWLLLALLLLLLLAMTAYVVRAWMEYNRKVTHRPWRRTRARA